MEGVAVGQHRGEHGVATLVVGGHALLLGREDEALAPGTHHDAVPRRLEVDAVDGAAAAPHGEQRGLVHQVGEVGAAHARRALGHHLEVGVGAQALVARVDAQDGEALVELGQRDHDLAVEAPGTQQRRVEDVGPVRGGQDDDALGRLEAVHLGQHLVEGLLPLVVPAAEAGAALAADGVDLVDEDDRPTHLAGRLEQVAHAAGADADEHLHEVRAGHREEADARLTGDGPGEERLAGARRTHQEHALGHARADLLEPLGHLEEVDDLLDLLLHALVAGDVGEGRGRLVGGVGLGPAAPDRHHVAHLPGSPALHPDEEGDDEHHGQQEGDELAEDVRLRVVELDRDLLVAEQLGIALGDVLRAHGRELRVVRQRAVDRARLVVDPDLPDLTGPHEVEEGRRVVDALAGVARQQLRAEQQRGDDTQQDPDRPAWAARSPAAPEASSGPWAGGGPVLPARRRKAGEAGEGGGCSWTPCYGCCAGSPRARRHRGPGS